MAEELSTLIAEGRYVAGARLPAERELCTQLGVSRVTLRRALQDVVKAGLLVASPQRGWFVATRADVMSEPPNALQSFTETGRSLGLTASAQVLAAELRESTIEEADALRIAPGAEILELRRLRELDGRPIALHFARVPTSRAPAIADADPATLSIYTALTDAGHAPSRSDCDVRAEPPTSLDVELLGRHPLLVVRQTTYDSLGEPIELSEMRYRGDRYHLRTSLHRRHTELGSGPV